MTDTRRTVTVHFHDGPRQITPDAWEAEEGEPLRPVFKISGYRVIETCGGMYIAVKDAGL